jgi:hypothetical protein
MNPAVGVSRPFWLSRSNWFSPTEVMRAEWAEPSGNRSEAVRPCPEARTCGDLGKLRSSGQPRISKIRKMRARNRGKSRALGSRATSREIILWPGSPGWRLSTSTARSEVLFRHPSPRDAEHTAAGHASAGHRSPKSRGRHSDQRIPRSASVRASARQGIQTNRLPGGRHESAVGAQDLAGSRVNGPVWGWWGT